MTELVTARLTLRKPRLGDLDAFHEIMTDPRAMRYWSRPAHDGIAQTREFLEAMIASDAEGGDEFVLVMNGRVIGKAGMWRRWEIGFLLHPDHWGRGLAHEAVASLIAHLCSHPTDHLTAEADPRNTASLRLLARLGFVETHRAENTLLWGDEWCDSVYLRLDLTSAQSPPKGR